MIKTEFGNAFVDFDGYYKISNGINRGKTLHKCIWEHHYNKTVPNGCIVHHIDGDKLNNKINNLICVPNDVHVKYHAKRIAKESNYNKSKKQNQTGYYRVSIEKRKDYKQGFRYRYRCPECYIRASTIEKLEEKVKAKGLKWEKF